MYKIIFISIISGLIGGWIYNILFNNVYYNYYLTKTTVEVSPHSLVKAISRNDDSFILVDVRTEIEYNNGHIIGAINIPVYTSINYKDQLDNPDQIVSKFRELKQKYPNRTIIIYCSSAPCKTGAKTGLLLAKHGIDVKILAVGWNEWKYFPELFMKDIELKIVDMDKFVHYGPEPGEYKGEPIEICIGDSC